MAGVPVPAYEQFWTDQRSSLKAEYSEIVGRHPDAAVAIQQVFQVLCDIEDLASFTPASVGESGKWDAIVSSAEDNRESYCKALRGKPLFSALYGTYTVTLNELKIVLKASSQRGQLKQADGVKAGQSSQEDGFKEVRSRKRHSIAEAARSPKKAAVPPPAGQMPTKNFFAPLLTARMDTDADAPVESNAEEAAAPARKKSRRPHQ
jgi:hypothetical protein